MTEYQRNIIMGTYQNYDSSGLNGDHRGVIINCSGAVYIQQQSLNSIFVTSPLVITGASGGMAFGSGLTTSGYKMNSLVLENPPVLISGTTNYGLCYNSGLVTGCIYIGGFSGNAPYPGSGYISSGKGFALFPGTIREFHVPQLDAIYAAAETSGTAVSYMAELTLA
jgi:hypothetical protein